MKKLKSIPRGTKAGAHQSFQKVADIPMALVETESTLYGKTDTLASTAVSSRLSKTRQKDSKEFTRQRARRVGKIDPQTLLEIAQTALARLGESGVQVLAQTVEGNIVVTICGADIDGIDKTFRLSPPKPIYGEK